MPDDPDLGGIFGTPYVNTDALGAASQRVAGALEQARAAREKARTEFGTNIDSTVKSIDETVAELRKAHDSQWNLPLLAFGAGMLHTTPGVKSNFLNELGSGLGATVPVIANQRKSEQDFWSKIADLQQQRGSISAAPAKMDVDQAAKEVDQLQRDATTLEAAGIRGVPANQRIAQQQQKFTEQMQAKRQDQLTKMQGEARNDVKEMLKQYEGAQPQDIDAMVQMLLQDRIRKFNAQPGQTIKLDVPEITPEQQDRAAKMQSGLQKKGLDEYRAKLRGQMLDKANVNLKMKYSAFSSMTPEEQEALRQDELSNQIEQINGANKGNKTSEAYMDPMVFSPEQHDAIERAKAQHSRMIRIGEPSKEEIAANHLPVGAVSSRYANLPYADRQKRLAIDDVEAKKEMEPLVAAASELPNRLMKADEFMRDYDATSRKGWAAGWTPAIGSEEAQRLDKIAADLAFSNVPKGQGAISDAERAILQKANPSRAMERGAAQTLVNFYKEASTRANDQLAFFQNWQDTFKTTHGAMEAWNKYINSKQGSILKADENGHGMAINPNRMTWREYFDRSNKGTLSRKVFRNGKIIDEE